MAVRFYKFLHQNSTLINLIQSKYFTIIMLVVVVSNTFIMIFETYDLHYHKYNTLYLITERIYLCIYIIEFLLKFWVYSWKYFQILWNSFDLFLILISIIDLIAQELIYDITQSSLQIDSNQQIPIQSERINHFLKFLRILRVLRSFRALRVLRTIRFIQPIHRIIKTCSKALPAMASITFIMIIITCISAIIARSLFGDLCPEKFNNLIKTFFSLFVLLTLDDWYSIYHICSQRNYSNFLLIFCLIYIFIINFILLNLLMAVLVDSFQHTLDYEQSKSEYNIEERILKNLKLLTEEYCPKKRLDENLMDEELENNHLKEIDKIMKKYYMLMESLEFRMERHEQLSKLAEKAIKLTLIDQDNPKINIKK